jgi:hypothetical protein
MTSPSTALQPGHSDLTLNSNSHEDGLVSVIIPNYNHAQYIGDAIQSVLNQTYRNFEIIVVDDGSKDNSREVISHFGNRVQAIFQQNQGLSAARNTGIRAARGAYIGVLDADDMYEPNFMSTLVSLLQAQPDADGIYCGYQFVDHLNNPLPQIEARTVPAGQLYQVLLDGNFLVPESMLVRHHCYEIVGPFDESLRACEDWDMWLNISGRYNIIGTSTVLTRHRILPGSMSTDPIRMLNNRLAVLQKHFGPKPTEAEVASPVTRRAYGRAYLTSCVEYLQYQNQERAYDCFQDMAIVSPTLLTELDTFYQLGCGDQSKGALGTFASLNLQQSSQVLETMLNRLFNQANATDRLKTYQRRAFANAFFALGLLSYGARQFREARRFLLRVLITYPGCGLNLKFVVILFKSLLGARLVNQIKTARQR